MKKTSHQAETVDYKIYDVIRSQHVSEKANMLQEAHNQYVFKVPMNVNKHEIKNAVEHIFNVKVESVNTTNKHKKTRRFKNILGTRKAYKKAYVKLNKDQKINIIDNE